MALTVVEPVLTGFCTEDGNAKILPQLFLRKYWKSHNAMAETLTGVLD